MRPILFGFKIKSEPVSHGERIREDTRLHRKVALKVLPAELAANKDRTRRFEQEAQAAAALSHPNIAHIYEVDESDGTSFIAMEFIEGFFAWSRDGKQLSVVRDSTTTDLVLIQNFT